VIGTLEITAESREGPTDGWIVYTFKNAQTSQDFEDWLVQKGDARKLSKEIVPPEFRSLFEG
jgi:hypothetical protein